MGFISVWDVMMDFREGGLKHFSEVSFCMLVLLILTIRIIMNSLLHLIYCVYARAKSGEPRTLYLQDDG